MAFVFSTQLISRTASQFVRECLLLPFWWYGAGLMKILQWYRDSLASVSALFGLRVWVKNLFVPMYGDTAFVGRLISFAVRLFVIIVRGFGVFIWAFLLSLLCLMYLLWLPMVAIFFLIHVFGIFIG